jgi:hypothetical protein
MESSCEFGIEPSGSMKCWDTIECRNNSSDGKLFRVGHDIVGKNRIAAAISFHWATLAKLQINTMRQPADLIKG